MRVWPPPITKQNLDSQSPGSINLCAITITIILKKISTQIKVDRKGKGNFRGRKAVVSTKPINSDKRSKFMSTKMTLFACPPPP